MIVYQNVGKVAKIYYGIQWLPGEKHEAPGYINDKAFLRGKVTESSAKQYTIKFKDFNGKLLSTQCCAFGDTPTPLTNPIRKSSNSYSYTFIGWKPEIVPATSDTEYVATYSKTNIRATSKTTETTNSKHLDGGNFLDGKDNDQ